MTESVNEWLKKMEEQMRQQAEQALGDSAIAASAVNMTAVKAKVAVDTSDETDLRVSLMLTQIRSLCMQNASTALECLRVIESLKRK